MTDAQTLLRVVSEAQMPALSSRMHGQDRTRWPHMLEIARGIVRLIVVGSAAFIVVFIYVGVPIALLAGDRLNSLLHATLLAAAAVALCGSTILCIVHSTNLDV